MKKFLIAVLIMSTTAFAVVSDVEAKRLGGGGSIGRQSQSVGKSAPMQQQQAAKQATAPAAAPAAAPKPASPWKGMLGGALLGLGLGALLSHFGLGGALASMISTILMVALLALAVAFVVRMFRKKSDSGTTPVPSYAASYGSATPEIGSRLEPSAQPSAFQGDSAFAAGAASATPFAIPADFDVPGFLRHAKTYFIRLQAAWDKADINDMREFTTPEMFAELKLEVQERGSSPNVTDVVTLNAELVGLEKTSVDYLASVRFEGMIKEAAGAPAEPFTEIWNLSKPVAGQGGWVLAGIQQIS